MMKKDGNKGKAGPGNIEAVPKDTNAANSLAENGAGAKEDKTSVRRTLLLEGAKALAAATVGGALALASPIRSLVFDRLWTTPPRLMLVPPLTAVHVDDEIAVGVLVEPVFPGVVPTGVLTFVPPTEFEPLTTLKISVAGGDQAKLLLDGSNRIKFRATKPGRHTLTAEFRSAGREQATANTSVVIEVAPRTDRKYATINHFAGEWRLILGGNVFPMSLTEPKVRTIAGTAEIQGATWRVYGSHDGGNIQIYLENPTSTATRIFLTGDVKKEGNYIKAKGKVIAQKVEYAIWVDKAEKSMWQSFEADTPTGQ